MTPGDFKTLQDWITAWHKKHVENDIDPRSQRQKEFHEQTRGQLAATERKPAKAVATLEKVMHQFEEKRKADVLRDKQIHDMTRQMIQTHHGKPIAVKYPRDASKDGT